MQGAEGDFRDRARGLQGDRGPVSCRDGASLADCPMSGLAMFGLEDASLLKFDESAGDDATVRTNLGGLWQTLDSWNSD